jgi:hypothetical protein
MGFRVKKKIGNWNIGKTGVTYSIKLGDTTFNIGKGRVRTTHNFGNGITYVKQRSTRKKTTKSSNTDEANFKSKPRDYLEEAKQQLELEEYNIWFNSLSDEQKIIQTSRLNKYYAGISRVKRAEETSEKIRKSIEAGSILIICIIIIKFFIALIF